MASSFLHRLYTGTGAFDIVGKRRRLYIAFGVLVLICLVSIVFRGFNMGIEFKGGTSILMPAKTGSGTDISTSQVSDVYRGTLNSEPASVQVVGNGNDANIQIKSVTLTNEDITKLKDALTNQLHPSTANDANPVSDSTVSSSWGKEISQKALIALVVFLVLVTIFLILYFERWMAIAALISLFNDIVVSAGVYSVVGFEVTPATVIGLLTILGFSLYDVVVVFDRVKENTRGLLGLTRRTYAEAANLALNQTLMRSINTSLIALLPVLGLLVVGVGILGVGTLQDLALVQLTGMLIGAVSSLFLATPLLVDLKMTEPKYKQQAERVMTRRRNAARRAESGLDVDGIAAGDDDALDAELRQERAMAAASSVPARNPKASEARRGAKTAPASRPTGKKRR